MAYRPSRRSTFAGSSPALARSTKPCNWVSEFTETAEFFAVHRVERPWHPRGGDYLAPRVLGGYSTAQDALASVDGRSQDRLRM